MTDYDAVLLDLDGTLCEYVRGTGELLSVAFESAGVDPLFSAADYHAIVDEYADRGDSMRERRELCFAHLAAENGHDPELGRAVAEAYDAARDHGNVRFLDGARELLDALSGFPLALVTNGGPGMQDRKIDGLGVRDRFETIVYAGHDVPAKPDPEPFERALGALDVPAERAIHVGNRYEPDVVGPSRAGMDAVLVGDDAGDGPVDPVAVVGTPGDAVEVL